MCQDLYILKCLLIARLYQWVFLSPDGLATDYYELVALSKVEYGKCEDDALL